MEDERIKFVSMQTWETKDKYKHLIRDKTLSIYVDGNKIITLESDDIIRMLKTLGVANHSFMKGY